jgi:hypothetical protein
LFEDKTLILIEKQFILKTNLLYNSDDDNDISYENSDNSNKTTTVIIDNNNVSNNNKNNNNNNNNNNNLSIWVLFLLVSCQLLMSTLYLFSWKF